MSYDLRGILGPDDVVAEFARSWLRKPVRLSQRISLLPVTVDLIESVDELVGKRGTAPFAEFEFLTSSLLQLITHHSKGHWIVYFENEYFGGTGTQAAALWRNGELNYGPRLSSTSWDSQNQNDVVDNGWPINEVLRIVGVWTDGGRDEFDSLELGKYRSTEDFNAA